MDFAKAGQAHNDWKVKFRLAIARKERMDIATIAADNCCEFGKWLHGEATRHAALGQYVDCKTKHAAFHVQAGKVAALINDGKFAEAEAAIGAGTPFASTSFDTVGAIGQLQKAIG